MNVFQCNNCMDVMAKGDDIWATTRQIKIHGVVYNLDVNTDDTPPDYHLCRVCFLKGMSEMAEELLSAPVLIGEVRTDRKNPDLPTLDGFSGGTSKKPYRRFNI